jgi:hypothetical protein
MEHVFDFKSNSPTSPSFPHAFSATWLRTDQPQAEAGIQAESGLDPRLKHSGVRVCESHLVTPSVIFEGGHEEHGKKIFTGGAEDAESEILKLKSLRTLCRCGESVFSYGPLWLCLVRRFVVSENRREVPH